MQLHQVISEAVDNVAAMDRSRKALAERLLPLQKHNLLELKSAELLEKSLISPVEKAGLDCKIAGVDSGFIGKDLLALDLILIRSVGVVFSYERNRVAKADYYPSIYSFPEPHLSSGSLEFDEFQCNKSIQRLLQEVSTAKALIEKFSPKFCFLDGSMVPQYADKPRKDSRIKSAYHKMLEEFQSLYETAAKANCELIACVEDSRGSRFRQILQEHLLAGQKGLSGQLDNCYDAVLLDYLLKPGQRSLSFTYTSSIKEHPILMDFDEGWARAVHAFYIKPVAFDRPLRVEFLHPNGESIEEHASSIASTVFAQSCMHREYAYPAILIEADFNARLKPQEIEIVYDKILNKLGKGFKLRLRRDNRPF
ncbi:MAG: DNA double-strand break repair nuclease NurA [Candidatus Diapherotrites archaeon]|uniref:DNA double-strand break repair nuclease NurA n=1 Tax=Candidatus Iainarchaeum sp. TaxID=3101447 RepID=A0A938YWB2_9ARCH|nr:DNA double-strand break repair nuclease NurA [Candidatus Diapherotrites archaeon]